MLDIYFDCHGKVQVPIMVSACFEVALREKKRRSEEYKSANKYRRFGECFYLSMNETSADISQYRVYRRTKIGKISARISAEYRLDRTGLLSYSTHSSLQQFRNCHCKLTIPLSELGVYSPLQLLLTPFKIAQNERIDSFRAHHCIAHMTFSGSTSLLYSCIPTRSIDSTS